MPEEKKKEEEKTEEEDPSSEPIKKTMVDKAKDAAAEIRAANKEKRELLDREEKLQAEKELGGTGGGGIPTKSKYTEEQLASRKRIKAVGDASGAEWAKEYE